MSVILFFYRTYFLYFHFLFSLCFEQWCRECCVAAPNTLPQGFLWVLWFPPTYHKHACSWTGYSDLCSGVNECVLLLCVCSALRWTDVPSSVKDKSVTEGKIMRDSFYCIVDFCFCFKEILLEKKGCFFISLY